jgi:hypothetical protein
MKILEIEDEVKNSIENHRIIWCLFLGIVGVGLGILSGLSLGTSASQIGSMSLVFSIFLVSAELTLGGKY